MFTSEEIDHWARFIVQEANPSLPEGFRLTVILVQDVGDSKDEYMSACVSSLSPPELYDVLMGTANALPEKVAQGEVEVFEAENRGKGN